MVRVPVGGHPLDNSADWIASAHHLLGHILSRRIRLER